MVDQKKQIVSGSTKIYDGFNPADYITIHETANTSMGAGAQAHGNLQSKGNVRNASWHYSIDDDLIVQSFEDHIRCWHSGDGRGPGNYSSLAFEICVNPDSDFEQAVANAAWLTRIKMAEHDIPISRVVQHNHWSGKDCPNFLRDGSKGITWGDFLELVRGAPLLPKPSTPIVRPAPPVRLTVSTDGRWGPQTAKAQQRIADTSVDGVISHQLHTAANRHIYAAQFDTTRQGSMLGRWIQRRLRTLGLYSGAVDGLIGPKTILALQTFYRTQRDGTVSPVSSMVRAMQVELNNGSFLGVR